MTMPWRASPKAALSSPLTMVVAAVTALLACFLGTAAVLQASAAGGATAQYQAALAYPDTYGPTFSKTGAAVASTPAAIAAVERHAAAHGFGRPVAATYTPVIRDTEFNGANHYRIRLAYRGDQTLDRLELLRRQGLSDALVSQVPFERSAQIAGQAQTNVAISILPLAAISVLVGCASIATVALQWYQRRFAQLRLLSSRGSGPAALGGLVVAELGLPIATGGVAGAVLARVLRGVYGPPRSADDGAVLLSAGVAAAVLVVSLGLLALVVRSRAQRDFERGRIRRASGWQLIGAFPWELATAGLAFFGWTRMIDYGDASKWVSRCLRWILSP